MEKTRNTATKILSIFLVAVLTLGLMPMSAFALGTDSLPTYEEQDDWGHFGGGLGTDNVPSTPLADDTEFIHDENFEKEVNTPNNIPTGETKESSKDTLPEKETPTLGTSGKKGQLLPWAANVHEMAQKPVPFNVSGVSVSPIAWGGGDIQLSGGTYYIGSGYLYRITHSDGEAFCAEFNGTAAGGNYIKSGDGSSPAIKQVIANYEKTNKTNSDYITAQVQIWSILLGAPVTSWGGSNPNMSIVNGTNDTSNTTYTLHENKDVPHTQNIFTFKDAPKPDQGLRIVKKNEDGSKVLAGAKFKVTGPNGFSHVGTTNSKGIIDVPITEIGTYTVTETQPPTGYDIASPSTKTATIDAQNTSAVVEFNNPLSTPDPEEYKIKIIKRVEGTNELLEGATFEIRHTTHGVIGTFTSNSRGEIEVTVPWAGTYIVTEISAPAGYVMPADPDAEIYVDIDNPEAERTFFNAPYTGIEVTKIDASTGQKLAGATIKIEHISTGVVHTKETGSDGIARFSGLQPGDYAVQEIQAPSGYVLNNTVYPVALESNKLASITIQNEKKSGLIIKKVDPNGNPIAGAVFELRTGGGTVLTRETTDVNGIIFRGNLPTDTYVVEEIQAPEGYVLDPNNPQSIYIDTADANKEYTLTFVNQKRPALEILKVDANDSSIVLFGATFRVAEQGGSKTWDITTNLNGIARLENLDPNMTYVVTEIVAPNGYLLSDFNQAIVLEVGKTHKITVSNKKEPSIVIMKKDKDTGLALAGATFRIAKAGGSEYQDITSDGNGKATSTGLVDGWYTITEIKAPDGYLLDDTVHSVLLEQGKDTVIELFNELKPSLEIIKLDSVTKERLPYAVFRITKKDSSGQTLVGEYTTDANGEIHLDSILPGRYLIEEIEAPDGYNIDTTVKEITIEYGKKVIVEFLNTAKSPLFIQKIDQDGNALRGAKFVVKTMNGGMVGTYTTGQNGYAIVPYAEPGWYVVEEIQAPDGYIINTTPINVELKSGIPATVEFVNVKKPGLSILKLDSATQMPLLGARMKIAKASGEFIGEYTTDQNGVIHLIDLLPDSYVVTEVTAPDGYILDGTPQTVTLKASETKQLTFFNTSMPGLSILKLDADTQKPLLGARMKIATVSGELIGEYTTDQNGVIHLNELQPDSYLVTEIMAPDGYILDLTPQTVALKAGETKQLTFFNTSKPGLQLLKKDKVTGLPVSGAMFNVTYLENGAKRDLGSFTTGENGMFFIPDLTPGNYVITEIKSPDGYILDPTPQNIFVEGGRLNTVEFYNIPYSSLRLLKINAEDRAPLEGAIFKLYDEKRLEVGTYETTALGEILIPELPAGVYYLQEVQAPTGFVLDSTVRKIELIGGKTTTVEVKNSALGSLRILKRDKSTGKPLYGATFLLYDSKSNVLGEFTTDQNGLILFGGNLKPGSYKLKEIKAPDGFVLDETIRTITIRNGETTEITIDNIPETGKVQLIKIAAEKSTITKAKKGDPLAGAVFEIFNEKLELVDTITTDKKGTATSKDLPLGKYVMKETKAPDYFYTDGEPIYFEIKVHDDLIRFKVENTPEEIEVTVEKRGVVEAMAGDIITYEFADIGNKSNCSLDEFYWRDNLPTDAVRIQTLNTGTWNEKVTYDVYITTNQKTNLRKIKSNLHSNNDYTIDLSSTALGLASNEYVTSYKLVFGTVEAGFAQVKAPFITCKVLDTLPNGYRFVNKTDVGGKRKGKWTITTDSWITITWKPKTPLPKTGY